MSALSNYLETELADHVFGKGTRDFTSPANLYVALFTAAPSDSGGGTELTIASLGYARVSATFGAAASGVTANSADIEFGPNTSSNWGTITHFGIFDASTAGNLLVHGALTASKTVNVGDTAKFATGELTVTFA